MSENFKHVSVLLDEAVEALAIKEDGIYVDCTFGRGGHSREILKRLGPNGRLIAIDRDPQAIAAASDLAEDSRFTIVQNTFAELENIVASLALTGAIDGVLVDLGVSSPQLDDPERGFSFMHDGPLDMRMDPDSGESAAQWLARADVDDIAFVLKEYGEERHAKKIARAIVHDRQEAPFERTRPLAEMIARVNPSKEKNKHGATRSFQAIRIHINGELDQAKQVLDAALSVLAPEGRLSVISFHSLEDRLVKRFIREHSTLPKVPKGLPIMDTELQGQLKLKAIGKAIKPSKAELDVNNRARSSVLRIAERLG